MTNPRYSILLSAALRVFNLTAVLEFYCLVQILELSMQAVKSLEGQGYTVEKEYPITRHVSRQFPHEMTTGRKRKRSEV